MNGGEQLTNEAYEIQPLWPSPSFLFRVTGRSKEFPPGDAFSSPPSVLALLFHGEGLTRHFHFDKRPTQNTPCRGWKVWAKTNTHGPPATTFSPIKQYLLYCTKQWIRTEILHNVILVGAPTLLVLGCSPDMHGGMDGTAREWKGMWRQYFIGAFNGTILMAVIRPF